MIIIYRELCTKHFFRHGGVKNTLECSFTLNKLHFFDNFFLAKTKNLHRVKLSYRVLFMQPESLTIQLIFYEYYKYQNRSVYVLLKRPDG